MPQGAGVMGSRFASTADVFRQVWRNRDLRRVSLAFAGFNLAEHGAWVAMLVYAFSVGGATTVGLVGFAQLACAAAFAPIAATFGDRYRRDRVLTFGYLIQAAAMGATAAVMLLGGPAPLAFAVGTGAAVSVTFTRPVQSAVLPALATTPYELTAANVLGGAIQGLGLFLGPAVAGVVLGAAGTGAVFAVLAAVALAAALTVRRIAPVPPPRIPHASSEPAQSFAAPLVQAFAAIREGGAGVLIGLLSAQAVVVGSVEILLVVLAIDMLHLGDSGVGFLNAAFGAGSAFGAIAAALLVSRRRLAPSLVAAALTWAVALSLIGLLPTRLLAPILIATAGIGRTVIDVAGQTLLQRVAPDRVLSRVFGMLEGLTMLGMAVGLAAVPVLLTLAGNRATFAVMGVVLLLLAVAMRSRLIALDASAHVPAERVALLRRIPFFATLTQLALERIARRLAATTAPPGTILIREGDRGDRFYILDRGEVVVTVAGAVVDQHGAGGFFGEIALLRNVPRTATVTVTAGADVLVLARDDFLEALTGHDESRGAAETIAEARLERGRGANRSA